MTVSLTNEEKISIINQHIRNLEFAEYNAYLDLLQANVSPVSEESIAAIEDRKAKIAEQIDVLESEKASLL